MINKEHPSKDITGSISGILNGKRIVLGVTGSVGASKSPETARLLMRYGAEVYTVLSESACKLITPELMFWSTGNKCITKLTGEIEHVALCGNVSEKADLYIIAPATANTIGKIANGIDDTTVTTFATSAIGEGIPLLIVPAMHLSMYKHPIVLENIRKLESLGIKVLMPRLEEGKAKIVNPQNIVDMVIESLSSDHILKNKKILINAGRTVEYIDPIRLLTNNSTGKMGTAIARQALNMGAEVTLLYANGTATPPSDAKVIRVDTSEDMKNAVVGEISSTEYDYIILTAAIADFRPIKTSKEKISTHTSNKLILELEPTPKILDLVKKDSPSSTVIAFRALHNLDEAELIENAYLRMQKADADYIAVNDVSDKNKGFGADTNEMFIIDKDKNVTKIPLSSKDNVARQLLTIVSREKEQANK